MDNCQICYKTCPNFSNVSDISALILNLRVIQTNFLNAIDDSSYFSHVTDISWDFTSKVQIKDNDESSSNKKIEKGN